MLSSIRLCQYTKSITSLYTSKEESEIEVKKTLLFIHDNIKKNKMFRNN